jgi:hypothetical protein
MRGIQAKEIYLLLVGNGWTDLQWVREKGHLNRRELLESGGSKEGKGLLAFLTFLS